MTETIKYRKAGSQDLPFLTKILIEAAEASGVTIPIDQIENFPDTYQYVEGFPSGKDVGIVAEDSNGQPVGAVWLRMLDSDEHAVKYPMPELTIGVVEAYQRKGIGTRLMNELYRYAADNGIEEISLGVQRDNLPALNLYLKQGWKQDGTFKDYIMMSRKTSL